MVYGEWIRFRFHYFCWLLFFFLLLLSTVLLVARTIFDGSFIFFFILSSLYLFDDSKFYHFALTKFIWIFDWHKLFDSYVFGSNTAWSHKRWEKQRNNPLLQTESWLNLFKSQQHRRVDVGCGCKGAQQTTHTDAHISLLTEYFN